MKRCLVPFSLAIALTLAPAWASAWVRTPRDSPIVIHHQVHPPRVTPDFQDRWPHGQPRVIDHPAGSTLVPVQPPNRAVWEPRQWHFDGVETRHRQ